MKKIGLGAAICTVVLLIGYYVVSNNVSAHPRVNASEVQSIIINSKVFEAESNTMKIEEFMQIYNSAKAFKKSDGTTPAYIIVIELKNGGKIDIEGTTQGFHYVNNGEKSYKIASDEMTYYLRDVLKQE